MAPTTATRVLRPVISGSLLCALAFTFSACPRSQPEGVAAIVLGVQLADSAGKSLPPGWVSPQDLAGLQVTVEKVRLEPASGSDESVETDFDEPEDVDLLATDGSAIVLGTMSLPVGSYVGGELVCSEATARLAEAPEVSVPVALPGSGSIPFVAAFEAGQSGAEVLILRLNDIRVQALGDGSLELTHSLEVEAYASDDVGAGEPIGEALEASGRIDDLNLDNLTMALRLEEGRLKVALDGASVLLPAVQQGGEPQPGTLEDLQEGMHVMVHGSLVFDNGFRILADQVTVTDVPGEDDDDDDHSGMDGMFDEHGNTSGFGMPSGMTGNAFAGQEIWNTSCAACHPNPYGEVEKEPYSEIAESLNEVFRMSFLDLTSQQVADVTAFLNWDGTGTPQQDLPAAPAGVQASDGSYTDRTVVSWTLVDGATGYEVWRNTVDSSDGATLLGTPVTTPWNDTTGSPATTYFYWVKAVNAAGASGFSTSDAGFRADAPPPVPDTPSNVQASDGTYTNRVAVTWNAVTGATEYQVWRGTTDSSAAAALLATVTGASYDDITAAASTTYFYWVAAVNESGTSLLGQFDTGFVQTAPTGPFDASGNTTAFGIPTGFTGNIAAGTTVWNARCTSCHPSPFGAVGAFTYSQMETRMSGNAFMSGITLSTQQKADLIAYLNRASATP